MQAKCQSLSSFFAQVLSSTHEDLPSSETCSETHRLSIVRFPDIAEFISFSEAFHYNGKTWFYLWNTSSPRLTSDIRRRQSKFSFLITTPFSFNAFYCKRFPGFSSLWKSQLASCSFETYIHIPVRCLLCCRFYLHLKLVLLKSIFKRIRHVYYNIIFGYSFIIFAFPKICVYISKL